MGMALASIAQRQCVTYTSNARSRRNRKNFQNPRITTATSLRLVSVGTLIDPTDAFSALTAPTRGDPRQEPLSWKRPGGGGRYPPDDNLDPDPSDGRKWTPGPPQRGFPMYGNTAGWADGIGDPASLPFHQAANAIPEFDGDPDNLSLFRRADQIYTQMRSIKQGPNEPVGEYGLRVDKLFNRFMTIVESAPDLSNSDRRARRRQARVDVLDQFLFGLKAPLVHEVRCSTSSNNNKNANNAKGKNKDGNGNNNGNRNGNKSDQKKNKNHRDSSAEKNSGIIGWDLIDAHKGCLDAAKKYLQLGDIKLPFESAELVTIPARVKMVIGARVQNDDVNVGWVPLQNLHPDLLFGKFTGENINGRVYAECISISDTEVTIATPTVELEEVDTANTNSPPVDEDGDADSDANSSAKIRRVINSDKHVEKYQEICRLNEKLQADSEARRS
ncbi:hypothetical protein TSAR_006279 [Trichomalopsis sarcophagae]|uniref:Uncharacterized protein n=1 Tax=Trichomalopsis sarcophagae TaxID=543379 RepID=A0A232ENT3_9HYME|nr:hypothetical protein TSAR_006279 [Trichomalopsis sarcophagae]